MNASARTIAAALASAIVVALPGCGDDEQPASPDPGASAREVQISPERAIAATEKTPEPPAAAPNLLGGDRDIRDLVEYLDDDLTLFFTETLQPAGARITPPTVRREPGPCDGATVGAADAPRYCDAQNLVFESLAGAEATRSDLGAAGLYAQIGWAHAQAAGDQMGWHDAVAANKLRAEVVKEAEACLFFAWLVYTVGQGVLEKSDFRSIDAVLNSEVFRGLPPAAVKRVQQNGGIGARSCVGA